MFNPPQAVAGGGYGPLVRWQYTFSGAGEAFSVVRPEMSKEMEGKVRGAVREILEEEGLI